MENEQNVNEDVVQPNLAEAVEEAAASEEEAQETQEPTAEQGETQDEQRVPYSRFKDVNDEKNYWKDMAMQQLDKMQQTQNPQQIQQVAQQQEQLRGNTPEEREFWKIVREEAKKVAAEQFKQVNPMLELGRQELAQLKIQQFRATHPDIEPNSPQEVEIAKLVKRGYELEHAYRAVMWDENRKKAASQAQNREKKMTQQKRQANVENTGVNQNVKQPPKKTFEEELADEIMNAGEITF